MPSVIALDAMGSDKAPKPEIEGALQAARHHGVRVLLVGPAPRLKAELARDTSAYALAGAFGVQSVIAPQQTRTWLIDGLASHRRERNGGIGQHEMRSWPTYI